MADRLDGIGEPASWASTQTRSYAEAVLAPLDPEEADGAVREALAAVMSEGNTSPDRMTVYAPLVRIEKPRRRNGAPTRLVRVRIRDRDRRVVHEVSVQDGAVTEHLVSEIAAPSLSAEEREEARGLLSADRRFGRLLDAGDVEVEWFNPGHGGERLVGARFVRVADHRVTEVIAEAVVDLDEATLVEGGGHGG